MSANDEIDEMHLKPNGWVQGSEKLDFQGWTHRPEPTDRLLTVRFREYMSSSFSRMELTADETRFASSDRIVEALKAHGTEPRPGAERYIGWRELLSDLGYAE